MTIQNQFVIGLGDIAQIRFQCKCGAALAYDPAKSFNAPSSCHQCGEDWLNRSGHEMRLISEFMTYLKAVAAQQKDTDQFQIQLIVEEQNAE